MREGAGETQGVERLRGKDVFSEDGEKLGVIDEIHYDRLTEMPIWFVIGSGLLSTQQRIVPVAGMTYEDDRVLVPYTKAVVESEPEFSLTSGSPDPEAERRLLQHFELSSGPSA
jgi:hypothetical protein